MFLKPKMVYSYIKQRQCAALHKLQLDLNLFSTAPCEIMDFLTSFNRAVGHLNLSSKLLQAGLSSKTHLI